MTPVVLRWPADRQQAELLATQGVPRFFLVDAGAEPPPCADPLEDWVRLPFDGREFDARLDMLKERARNHPSRPQLDGNGRLIHNGDWVPISPTEERLLRLMIEHLGDVVGDEDLRAAAWSTGPATSTALRIQVSRLRRRIRPLHLQLRTVRGRGYVLETV